MKFDSEELNKIPILAVAEKLGIVVKRDKAFCFIHNEKTPSLSFNKKNNYWHCFGCDKGGGPIDLVVEKTGLTFPEACQWLGDQFNIYGFQKIFKKNKIVSIKASKASDNASLNINQPDSNVYKWIIDNTTLSKKAYDFLCIQRKYPQELISKLHIKSVEDTNSLFQKCKLAFNIDRLLKCGVINQFSNSSNEVFYGLRWWQPSILIPYFNIAGDIINIQARTLDSSSQYRYINLNGINTCIYNLQAINELKIGQQLIICEGVTDCISSLAMKKPAIGIPGASGFKKEYIELIKSFKLIIVPDNDKAGQMFENKIKNLFKKNGKEVFISKLDKKFKDLSEFYINKYCKI